VTLVVMARSRPSKSPAFRSLGFPPTLTEIAGVPAPEGLMTPYSGTTRWQASGVHFSIGIPCRGLSRLSAWVAPKAVLMVSTKLVELYNLSDISEQQDIARYPDVVQAGILQTVHTESPEFPIYTQPHVLYRPFIKPVPMPEKYLLNLRQHG